MTDEFVFKNLQNILQENWGSCIPLTFPKPEDVKLYDSEQNEVVIPQCSKCNAFKNQIIGKESFMWFCPICGEQ